MKKLLLSAFAALTVMTAAAQSYRPFEGEAKSLVYNKYQPMSVKQDLNTENITLKDYSTVKAAIKQMAPAQNDIYGKYIETSFDDVVACTATELSSYVETDENNIETEYVKMVVGDGYAEIYGIYDPETGVINCGAQYCYDHEKYGKFVIYGLDDEFKTLNELSFTVQDDGSIWLDQPMFVIIMDDYSEQVESTQVWNFGFGTQLSKVNATENTAASLLSGGSFQDWEYRDFDVAVEDLESSVNVYGFEGLGLVSIDVNEDGTVSMSTGQDLIYMPESYDPDGVYGNEHIIGVTETEDNKIRINDDATEVTGTISGNTINIPGYFAIASNPDNNGARYWVGYFHNATITLNEGSFAAGIEELRPTVEDRLKNTKTYNIMGQQVDKNAKGIVIVNGKKYLNK